MASLGIWYKSAGSVSVETVTSPKVEMFYWGTILFSQTLGTALGDWMADTNGLGYEGGALVFGAALALVAAGYFFTNVSRTLLFWAAFILTRPLGATLGDLLDKPVDHGGFAFSRYRCLRHSGGSHCCLHPVSASKRRKPSRTRRSESFLS
jgi:uncharacterized membrane-anchored protein